MLFKNQVLGCGPSTSGILCFLYNVSDNIWTAFDGSQYLTTSSLVCNNKFYFFHETNPSIFDPFTKSWTKWPVVPFFSVYLCAVVHGKSILSFGGFDRQKVFKYDTVSNSWIQLNSTAPINMFASSCGVLPNGNVLIVGSYAAGYENSYAVYNVLSDAWVFSAKQNYFSSGAFVLSIGHRVFVVSTFTVYEFHYNTNIFSQLPFETLGNRERKGGQLQVPSGIFNSLKISCIGI